MDAILIEAQRSSSDLIVMGTHGRGEVSRLWSGSVTEGVLKRGRYPVLAARDPVLRYRFKRKVSHAWQS